MISEDLPKSENRRLNAARLKVFIQHEILYLYEHFHRLATSAFFPLSPLQIDSRHYGSFSRHGLFE